VALPVRDGRGPLLGFLYLDGRHDDLQTPAAADLLGRISPLLVLAFEPWPQPELFVAGVPRSAPNAEQRGDERARALQLLEEHDWNATRVAEAMGVSRPGLDVRLARLGIRRESPHARESSPGADQSERATLLAQLTQNEWNVSRVARIMGTARGTIYTRMAQLGIQRQRIRKSPPRRRRSSTA
jgi:transcriptional regulator of acetoin/glycerol metabolism